MKTKIDNYEFITFNLDVAEIVFTTAKNNLDFNRFEETTCNTNFKLLCDYFKLNEIAYVKQTHSNIVIEYDGCLRKGDAIITNKPNIGIGVFTADCVPVLIYDKNKKVAAAVHSGWKGTYEKICSKTVIELVDKYGCNPKDMVTYIGPHNRACCYDFGSDEAYKYFGEYIKNESDVYTNNKLNLEKCIIHQLTSEGIHAGNINTLDLCTYCNDEYEFYSYRRERDKNYGRNFSFVVLR